MIKTTSPANLPNPAKKNRKPRTQEVFDQDHAWKKFISNNFFDCLERLNPKLYADADKSVPPEFLEQEFYNDLRGKYKVKDKEKRGDKLVKIRLLSGQDHFVFLHSEIQDQLKDDIPDRVCTYRTLIHLRYQTHAITSVVIFTGKVPAAKHKIFSKECYGSRMTYSYISFIIARQSVRKLQKSDNLFDIALLAAKYTLNTEGNARRRLLFKKKVFEIALKKQIPLEKMEELLSFVFDYMLLPDKMENEFMEATPFYQTLNNDTMVITRGQKLFADWIMKSQLGMTYDEAMAKPQADLNKFVVERNAERQQLLAEKAKLLAEKDAEREADRQKFLAEKEAEKQKLISEKEAEKEAEKELANRKTIKTLLGKDFSPEKIADLLEFDLEYVQKVAVEFEQEKKDALLKSTSNEGGEIK